MIFRGNYRLFVTLWGLLIERFINSEWECGAMNGATLFAEAEQLLRRKESFEKNALTFGHADIAELDDVLAAIPSLEARIPQADGDTADHVNLRELRRFFQRWHRDNDRQYGGKSMSLGELKTFFGLSKYILCSKSTVNSLFDNIIK